MGATPARDAAWTFYRETFAEINTLAAQRHLMRHDEFTEVMTDGRITKYVLSEENDALLGLGTSTNDLSAWPLISPAYFERMYPEQYAAGKLWYIGFIGVRDGVRGGFAAMLEAMSAPQRRVAGVALMDYCAFNFGERDVHSISLRLLERYSAPRPRIVDTQTFVAYDFGER